MVTRSRLHAWLFDWGWLLVGALTVELTAFGLWLAVPGHNSEMLTFVTDLQVLPIRLGSTLLAWRAYRHSGLDARTRRAWLLLGLGFGAFCIGDIIWAWIEIVLDADPFPSFADVGYLSFYVLILAGLLSFPLALRTRGERLKFWLDALIVAGGGGTVIWYFVFLPVLSAMPADPIAAAFAMAYPIGDLLLLLGVALMLARPAPSGCWRPARR